MSATGPPAGKVTFFSTPAAFKKWLARHHGDTAELWVGLHRKDSGRPSITWPESVDEALCVGWIDGIRKRIDATSYMIRFTPRRKGSFWSAVNIGRVEVLKAEGRMEAAGLAAYAARREDKSGIYAYEQRTVELPEPYRHAFDNNASARAFLEAQPPSYRKLVTWYITSAKKEETRLARLQKLVDACVAGKRL